MIFVLSGKNVELARAEVEALGGKGRLYDNFLFLDAKFDYSRLAYTNKVLKFLFKCKKSDLKNKFESFNWKNVYKNNFCIRSNKTKYEKDFAKFVWDSVDNPKVQLVNSDTEIWIYFGKDVFVGKKVYDREEKFQKRRPDLRPGFYPVSIKPKLARALVNLSGVRKGMIWDPFCGTSGILIEAWLMGLKVIGSDLDPKMIEASKKNFKEFDMKGRLKLGDSRKLKYKCDAIVCDPPYGRRASLHKTEIEKLYKKFLENVYGFVDKVVLMAPNNVKVVSKYKKRLVAVDYVHGGLTRKIYVLTRD
ncbi:hypothetical protein CL616_03415 [archaeon]|nr:hypothetical protein [archaeon]|tara:strand:+ start:543 stop:1454 length:912 start_codon:yes stop_codon:yes gene_type:complete